MQEAKAAVDKAAEHDDASKVEGQASAKEAVDLIAQAVKCGMEGEAVLVRAKQSGRNIYETRWEAAKAQFNAIKHTREELGGLLRGAGFGSIVQGKFPGPSEED